MILLVGTNTTVIKKSEAQNVICPHCKCDTTISYEVLCKYTSITLIPLFPVEKFVIINCTNCGEEINLNELSDTTISKLAYENNNLKNPIWTFFGSFLLALVIIYGIYLYAKSNNETEKYIRKPLIGDVYCIKDNEGFYYSLKIDKIHNDSIYATENDYKVDLPYEIDDINKNENYTKKKIIYSKKELNKLYEENKITSIIRN